MKDKWCFTCKFQGKYNLNTQNNYIFHGAGNCQTTVLCYSHSVEFFKIGQKNFLAKYDPHKTEYFGYEDDKLTLSYFNNLR